MIGLTSESACRLDFEEAPGGSYAVVECGALRLELLMDKVGHAFPIASALSLEPHYRSAHAVVLLTAASSPHS